jgi:hypothetical protein
VLAAWFDHFFADKPDTAADERIIRSALERIAPADAATPSAEKLLQRAISFYRARGLAHEYFQLADAVEDRRVAAVWEPARTDMLIPRGSV